MDGKRLLFLVSLLCFSPWEAHAEVSAESLETQQAGADETVTGLFEMSGRFERLSEFGVDSEDTTTDADQWGRVRLRLGLNYRPLKSFKLVTEGEMRIDRLSDVGMPHGLLLGSDTFRVRRDADGPILTWFPRQLYFEAKTPVGLFRCGHQTTHWGLGILVNDGAQSSFVGDGWTSSTVERCLVGWPLFGGAVIAYVAGDVVYEDDNAQWLRGDRAFTTSLGVRVSPQRLGAHELSGGLLVAHRRQRDRADELRPTNDASRLEVTAVDLHAQWSVGGLSLASELVALLGWTDRLYVDETQDDGARIQAFGALVAGRYESGDFGVGLDLGYASGDNDPQDDTLRQFSFHSGHQAGLILFEHVLPAVTARAVDQIMSPDLLDMPPSGLRFTVAQGGVRNAIYAWPQLSWSPLRQLSLSAAYLLAYTAADLVDPYQSALLGGYNTTPGGRSQGGRRLGQELDLRVGSPWLIDGHPLEFGFEVGVFLPGTALDGVVEETVMLTRFTLDGSW